MARLLREWSWRTDDFVLGRGHEREPVLAAAPSGEMWAAWLHDSEDFRHGLRPVVLRVARIKANEAVASAKAVSREPVTNLRALWVGDDLTFFALSRYKGRWSVARAGRSERWPPAVTAENDIVAFDLVADSEGRPVVAYQTLTDGQFQVYLQLGWKGPRLEVGSPTRPKWNPLAAPGKDGRVWVVWETFYDGLFRVFARQVFPDGGMGPVLSAPADEHFCLDASAQVDASGRLWLACRIVEAWGRNDHFLNGDAGIRLVCLGADRVLAAYDLPIPADPAREKLPARPTVLCCKDGSVAVFFRWFRRAMPNDWGWDVNVIRLREGEWSEVRRLASDPGDCSEPIRAVEAGDEWVLCCQACTYDGRRDPPYDSRIHLKRVRPGEIQGFGPRREGEATRASVVSAAPRPDPPMGRGERAAVEIAGQNCLCFWGDLHRHTHRSKCLSENDGSLLDHYRWAVETAGLDFYAVTDHYAYINADDWADNLRLADLYDAPGVFAALLGYEWHHQGHVNFYFLDEATAAQVWREHAGLRTLDALYAAFDAAGLAGKVAAIRHYHADELFASARQYWESVNPAYESVVEVVQTRGFAPQSYEWLLARGRRLGAVGASDHSVRPSARDRSKPYEYAAAITGLFAPDLSRGAVFEAIRRRRTFAVNGKKMVVWLQVDDLFMGDEGATSRKPVVRAHARATTEIERVQIIRDGRVVAEEWGGGEELSLEFADEGAEPGEHYYYVKAFQRADAVHSYPGQAWSSPVWATVGAE